jgi:hypothetical protein
MRSDTGSWLIGFLLFVPQVAAAKPPAATNTTEHENEQTKYRIGDVGDNSEVDFLSPLNILSHVQVHVNIFIGARPPARTDRPAQPTDSEQPQLRKRKAAADKKQPKADRKSLRATREIASDAHRSKKRPRSVH